MYDKDLKLSIWISDEQLTELGNYCDKNDANNVSLVSFMPNYSLVPGTVSESVAIGLTPAMDIFLSLVASCMTERIKSTLRNKGVQGH